MKYIPNAVTRSVAMTALKTSKHSPTILFAAGVVGVVGTVVLASRATLKLEAILEDANAKLDDIKVVEHAAYSDHDRTKDKAIVLSSAAFDIGKLYAPAFFLGAVSIGCLAGSHRLLTRRNAALTAAYAGLDKAYREYRKRVQDAVGEEKELEIYRATEVVEAKDADGKKQKVKVTKSIVGSPYARVFDETNPNFNKTPENNRFFLSSQQNYANDLLRARGHVFLNEVYDMLGMDRSKEGAVVGWLYDQGTGDDYIDFGVFENDWQMGMMFVTGQEPAVWLDFNVDGIIYDQI